MAELTLFTKYTTLENRVTNYCGLMLKLMYEERPTSFAEVMHEITGNEDLLVGPRFLQQTRQGHSVPDLTIDQNSFRIVFEVKLSDWFTSSQITAHIEGLAAQNDAEHKTLILLTNEVKPATKTNLADAYELAADRGVELQTLTFFQFLNSLKTVRSRYSDALGTTVDELEHFLESEGLLPDWKYRLAVVNCARETAEIRDYQLHFCPDTGGSYSFRRCRFFGAYTGNKTVTDIADIEGIVVASLDDSGRIEYSVSWNNEGVLGSGLDDDHLLRRAREAFEGNQRRREELDGVDMQVFLLANMTQTEFVRSGKGGLYGTKTYFKVENPNLGSAPKLASALDGESWPADKVIN